MYLQQQLMLMLGEQLVVLLRHGDPISSGEAGLFGQRGPFSGLLLGSFLPHLLTSSLGASHPLIQAAVPGLELGVPLCCGGVQSGDVGLIRVRKD